MATNPKPEVHVPKGKGGNFLLKDFHGMPMWVWIVAGVAGLGLGYYLYTKNKANQSITPTPDTTPVDNIPTGNNAPQQPTTINLSLPPGPNGIQTTLTLVSTHPVNLYASAGQVGGSPDAVIGTIPAGSTVQATGPEVVGAWNKPGGSELWYPVIWNTLAGYISAEDVANANGQGGSGQFPINISTRAATDYDKRKGFTGVPLKSTPGGNKIQDVPYNTQVSQTAAIVTGPSNQEGGGGPKSSNWYPVTYQSKPGFISATDILNGQL